MASRRPKQKASSNIGGSTVGVHVTVEQTDMDKEMSKAIVDLAKKVFPDCAIEKDLAAGLKRGAESLYPETTWHCIAGTHFVSSVTHSTSHLMFMKVNNQTVLLFRSID